MIRLARPADLDAVRRLVRNAYGHYVGRLGREPAPMVEDYRRRIEDGQVWVLEQDGSVAGLIVLEDADGALLLDNIAVDPSAQHRGFGKALMAFTEAEARRRGWREVRLYTNVLMTENIALYRRLGFAETGSVTEKGYERVYMAKPVA